MLGWWESQADETLGHLLPEPSLQHIVCVKLNLVDVSEKSLPAEGGGRTGGKRHKDFG